MAAFGKGKRLCPFGLHSFVRFKANQDGQEITFGFLQLVGQRPPHYVLSIPLDPEKTEITAMLFTALPNALNLVLEMPKEISGNLKMVKLERKDGDDSAGVGWIGFERIEDNHPQIEWVDTSAFDAIILALGTGLPIMVDLRLFRHLGKEIPITSTSGEPELICSGGTAVTGDSLLEQLERLMKAAAERQDFSTARSFRDRLRHFRGQDIES